MIEIQRTNLDQITLDYLAGKQLEINNISIYAQKVDRAKALWKNKTGVPFENIKTMLTLMCVGQRRCNYCEDSAADEIEHIKPKDIFPEYTFVWENYLYACGPCNGPKNNFFAVFNQNNDVIELSRKVNDPVVSPIVGDDAFINPRIENPLSIIVLDLSTMYFAAHPLASALDKKKADYTIEKLRLNSRDYLVSARKEAYCDYLNALKVYVDEKNKNVSKAILEEYENNINKKQHPTVWYEIKRQHQNYKVLMRLFQIAPELLLY